jgi:hypothetical protein
MRRRSITLLAVVFAAALPLTGCGGPITPGELSRSIQTLESTAAEGSLLAKDVARDRTKATFARVHSRDLADVVQHEAEKLHDARANRADVAAAKTEAVDLAGRIGTALTQIQTAPDSPSDGHSAAVALSRLSEDAKRLADGL